MKNYHLDKVLSKEITGHHGLYSYNPGEIEN